MDRWLVVAARETGPNNPIPLRWYILFHVSDFIIQLCPSDCINCWDFIDRALAKKDNSFKT